jgi:hypothetical protein
MAQSPKPATIAQASGEMDLDRPGVMSLRGSASAVRSGNLRVELWLSGMGNTRRIELKHNQWLQNTQSTRHAS